MKQLVLERGDYSKTVLFDDSITTNPTPSVSKAYTQDNGTSITYYFPECALIESLVSRSSIDLLESGRNCLITQWNQLIQAADGDTETINTLMRNIGSTLDELTDILSNFNSSLRNKVKDILCPTGGIANTFAKQQATLYLIEDGIVLAQQSVSTYIMTFKKEA